METTTILSILSILFTFFPCFTCNLQPNTFNKLHSFQRLLLTSAVGPESLAFDGLGRGPYTGVSDGRIMKWQGQALGWGEFAINSKNREEACNGSDYSFLESMCGRPLGLQFYKTTGDLYIADAYFGLLVVGANGGVATKLATGVDGEPFHFTNGVDVDQENGMVYFTDSSTVFQRRDYLWAVITGDATGRLMKYDPKSKNVSVLRHGLAFPNGVAISEDNTFLLVAETTNCRILRYWLRGPVAGTFEVFAQLPGYPDNIKKNPRGEFWVALNQEKLLLKHVSSRSRREISMDPSEFGEFGGLMERPVAVRISKEGRVLEVLDGGVLSSISEVEETSGTLWLGSVDMPYVGIYKP